MSSFAKTALEAFGLLQPARAVRHWHIGDTLQHWRSRASVKIRGVRLRFRGAPDGYPIPPDRLHFLVSGRDDIDVDDYFHIGQECAAGIRDLLATQSLTLEDAQPILDFGCGCARVLRHLRTSSPLQLHGTDINPEQIAWCRANLPFARFEMNGPTPPLPFGEASFGFIYTFSVFTHLPEGLQRDWLLELLRVLRPGGHLVMTTHGEAHARSCLERQDMDRFRSGSLVVVQPQAANIPATYATCGAYHPEGYVTEQLAPEFELVEFRRGGVVDATRRIIGQDVYLLRKPKRPNDRAVAVDAAGRPSVAPPRPRC